MPDEGDRQLFVGHQDRPARLTRSLRARRVSYESSELSRLVP
jgi:hypothetical protein